MLKSLSARQLFILFITIVAALFAGIGGIVINHQSRVALTSIQSEATKLEQESAKRHVLQYIQDRETAFKHLSSSPALVNAAMGNSVSILEIFDHIKKERIFNDSIKVALFDIASDLVFNEIDFSYRDQLSLDYVNKILIDNGSLIVSLVQKNKKQFFWMYVPITYNNSVEGVFMVEFEFNSKDFFSGLTKDGQRWIALQQLETNVNPRPSQAFPWRVFEVPVNQFGLTLLYGINTDLENQQRSSLLYNLVSTTFIAFVVCLIGAYLFGRKLLVQPFEELALSRQKLAESSKQLKIQEQESRRLAKVARYAKDVVIITDVSGEITWVNNAFTHLTQYEAEEVVGKKPGSLLQGKDTNAETKRRIRHAISSHNGIREEILNYNKSGEPYWIDIDINPVLDEHGVIEGFIAVERDISDKQRLQASLEDARDKAEKANAAKSHFLASISHEIRTPMNGILGIAQLINKTELTDVQQEYLDTLQNSGSHMMSLLNDLLDFSKIEAGLLVLAPESFSLLALINEIENTYTPLCDDKSVEFKCTHSIDDTVWLLGDSGRIRQVLTNLASNALKFTDKGSITVEVSLNTQPENMQPTLIVSVSDTGIGIDPSRHAEIFNPFIQAENSTTRNYGGTGLGLAIATQICKAMSGKIELTSAPNRGSQFVASFELQVGHPDTNQAKDSHMEYQAQGIKALIVEDNRVNRMIMKKFLEARGFECDFAPTGKKATELTETTFYPVILMDNHMPIMDGIQATTLIRAQEIKGRQSVIIGCTADAYATTREAMISAGCDDVLVKPVKETLLDSMLHRLHKNLVA
ncbi:ATP-binding protein [Vibrio penaeicida]|uniref:PAS domain-containing hybrid sensor histidine kinase/response regulator n=1 Tax=Vibrio penaeicida TaxID=104609 RepID=UPI002737797F|nr:ATP-binding protein [Vibrio penaeicida]MDP2572186.1 ATP-binding protein [Vibrio penaeicida]